MKIKRSLQILLMLTILICGAMLGKRAIAQDEGLINRLFAPGPLMKGHDNLEGANDCQKCHDSGKGVSEAKCLECHKEIRPFVTGKKGFHGLTNQTCIKCHSDHKGRTYDSTSVDQKTFDHSKTGYILAGKHKDIKCLECHKEKRGDKRSRPNEVKYLGAAQSCKSCHAKDDIHFYKGEFAKKDCGACHGLSTWTDGLRFDHKRDAKYELVGSHADLECQTCHNPKENNPRESIYKWPTLGNKHCLACHDDFHKNNLSPKNQTGKCTTCHTQTEWKIKNFDHELAGWPLRGQHAEGDCLSCHTDKAKMRTMANNPKIQPTVKFADLKNKNINFTGLGKQCLSCHDDYHRFGNYKSVTKVKAQQCITCHTEASWKKIHDFNHNASTRYAIDGEHNKLKCSECHLEVKKKPIPRNLPGIYYWPKLTTATCENCHTNVHIGKFSKELLAKRCTECHVTDGWLVVKTGKNFDHNKTRFPLTGKHTEQSCTKCHVKNKEQIFRWNSKDKEFCVECHQNVHLEQFHEKFSSQSCAVCHSTKDFKNRKTFDHSTTAYQLEGAHKKLECSSCHTKTQELFPVKPPSYMNLYKFPKLQSDKCLNCHKDVHVGQLGRDCLKCHTDVTWKNPKFDHQTQSRYPLLGKHVDVKCAKCHKQKGSDTVQEFKRFVAVIQYKPLPTQCSACHKDAHNGHFGGQCASCHTEQTWKTTKDFHKNFTLSGVHFTLQCVECHAQGRKLTGLSRECIYCHKKDDVHSGTLPQCAECHLQVYWEDSKFRHSMTTFPLKGAHRILSCQECHQNGVYQGLSSACISCHLTTVQAALAPILHQPLANYTNCSQCHHNPFAW